MTPKSHKSRAPTRKRDWLPNARSFSKERNRAPANWSVFNGAGLCLTVGIVIWFLYFGYLETRINTPLYAPKVVTNSGLDIPEMYWGTFRPGVYFGTRVRHPVSPVTGLMWHTTGHYQNNFPAIRHWCDQADDLDHYGWLEHNGKNYGSQIIRDKKVIIKTHFIKKPEGKYGGSWSVRIETLPKDNNTKEEASLFYYVALDPEDEKGSLNLYPDEKMSFGFVEGHSEALGNFRLKLLAHSGKFVQKFFLSTKHMGFNFLKESMYKGLRFIQQTENPNDRKIIGLVGEVFEPTDTDRSPNFVVFQVMGITPFQVDVIFESLSSNSQKPLSGDMLSSEIGKASLEFNERFENTFTLKSKEFTDKEIKFAKAALSNMIGGIGYFYGASKVQGENNKDPVPYWKAPLYSAVPSRSFFPRGFLWDEGFHNLLISKWDRKISIDILSHWFDLMNWDGWIPREQILGVEARARVPEEFVVQNMKAANPPTLLLTLHSMMTSFKESFSDDDTDFLDKIWPRLKAWYNWFNTTQFGTLPGTYRWRGRDESNNKELNAKTLSSGLDDYPRASHPTDEERHLDLRCWMTLAAGLMSDISRLIGKDPSKFEAHFRYLSNNDLLDSLHWSYSANGYMDYGLHTDRVSLKRLNPKTDKVRVVSGDPKYKYVDSFGYVSFFPLFIQVIDPHSVKLKKVLEDLRRPDLLWTPYGLRSIAKNSPFYDKWNTQHDPPYWRGSIWINMNYLAIKSLHYYSNIIGPYMDLAKEIYSELRNNVIQSVIKEYTRTGYLWEHYNDKNGKGEGCRPFTGWSALVVLMMGETYN